MTVYPMMEASYQQVNISRRAETGRESQVAGANQVREDQDVIKRFLTFSETEEDERKRKDSNIVNLARRMSTMVLGEKGMCPDVLDN